MELVKGIDQLLSQPNGETERAPPAKAKQVKDSNKQQQPKIIEFDIGTHLPKNFHHPILPLNEKNCPGLTETRSDFKPAPVVHKKRK